MNRGKAPDSRGVTFDRASAARIADTVRVVEGLSGKTRHRPGGSNAQAASHYLSKTTAAWNKGTNATLSVWVGDMGSEQIQTSVSVVAHNKFANVASGKWVMLARCNGGFYLVAAECS